jgi:hypothetical protein
MYSKNKPIDPMHHHAANLIQEVTNNSQEGENYATNAISGQPLKGKMQS